MATGARQKKQRRPRSLWMRRWLMRRPALGQCARLLRELRREDARGFKNFIRIDYELFKEILSRIEGRIRKQDNNYRKSLPGLRLAIHHLASGDSSTTDARPAFIPVGSVRGCTVRIRGETGCIRGQRGHIRHDTGRVRDQTGHVRGGTGSSRAVHIASGAMQGG